MLRNFFRHTSASRVAAAGQHVTQLANHLFSADFNSASSSCTNCGAASFTPSDPAAAHRISDFISRPHTAAPVERTASL